MLHPKAATFLRKANPIIRNRIKGRLEELRDSSATKGERLDPTDFWRLRIGDYRAIYEIRKKERNVIVLFIGHMRSVCDDISRLL